MMEAYRLSARFSKQNFWLAYCFAGWGGDNYAWSNQGGASVANSNSDNSNCNNNSNTKNRKIIMAKIVRIVIIVAMVAGGDWM